MKETSKKLFFIFIIAFVSFIIAFGKAFYEYGLHGSLEGLGIAFIFPIYYFILTVVVLVLMHNPAVEKRPYIIMAVLSIGFMAVMWIVYVCIISKNNEEFFFSHALWYPIVLSVLSLIMAVTYISIIVDIIKIDNKIKQNKTSNK